MPLPQPGVPIRKSRRRCAGANAGDYKRIGEFVRRIAVAGIGEAVLRAIEIEHLACDHIKFAFGPVMPAVQIAAIKPDDNRRVTASVSESEAPAGRSRAICSPTWRVRLRTVPALTPPPTGSNSARRPAT